MEFKSYKLKDIGKIVTGCTPKTKNEEYYFSKDYHFVGPTDLKVEKYVRKTEKYISEIAYKDYSSRFIGKNSIMVDCIGSDMGNVALTIDRVLTNQQINSITEINEKIFNIEYVYYVLSTMKKYFHQIGTNGSTMPIINKSLFEEIEIKLPKKSEQDKIAKILSSLDKKIELNNQISDNFQKLINKIFVKYFIEYEKSRYEIKETELGNIPIDWNICTLNDIVEFSNGYGFNSKKMLDEEINDSYKVFKMGNINIGGGINKSKTKSWMKLEDCIGLDKFIAKKGDILMCMTDMKSSENPLLGYTALIDTDDEFVINQRVGLLRCNKGISYSFVYTLSNLDFFIKDIRSRANSGVQVNLTTKGICETKVIIPSQELLDKFDNVATFIYESKFNILKENENLTKLRDTLLPKLMSGEIDLNKIKI